MGKVSYHFLLSLYALFFDFILLINFLGWSGGYVNLGTFTSTGVGWTNGYFGFHSINLMLNDCNGWFNNVGVFSLSNLFDNLENFGDALSFGIPRYISKFQTWLSGGFSWSDVLESLKMVGYFIAQPFFLMAYGLLIISQILYYVIGIVYIIMRALAGAYNVEFSDVLNYEDVQSEYDAVSSWLRCGIIGRYMV